MKRRAETSFAAARSLGCRVVFRRRPAYRLAFANLALREKSTLHAGTVGAKLRCKASLGGSFTVRIETLRKRAQFQRVRGGGRYSHQAFVLEGKARVPDDDGGKPRFGFTVTKKVGNAVVRNRIRRRIKAALSELVADHAECSYDYVVVARVQALDRPFADLKSDLKSAFDRVHGKSLRLKSPRMPT